MNAPVDLKPTEEQLALARLLVDGGGRVERGTRAFHGGVEARLA